MSAVLQHDPPMSRMTAEQFLDWDSGDDFRWQLIDGELVCMNPPAGRRARIHGRITTLLSNAMEAARVPYSVSVGPGVQPRVESKWNVRIPDLTVDCDAVGADTRLIISPVLIVEILSPGNARVTRSNVWSYRSIPSVRSILLLYGWKIAAELSLRTGPDWPDAPILLGAADRLMLPDLGLDVPLTDVYATADLAPPG